MKQQLSSDEQKALFLFEPYVQEWIGRSFDRLTPPQIQAWPLIAERRNTLIFSPSQPTSPNGQNRWHHGR